MSSDKSDLRIGELLIEAQIMRARELSEAITIAKLTSLPIGRILVMSSYVGEKEFRAALEAQSLVRDSILPLRTAIQALSLMHRKDLSFEDALKEAGFSGEYEAKTNKLGELLIAAGIITSEQMEQCLKTSTTTGLPMGRVLISLNLISEETLTTALNAQVFIREGKIQREQGVAGMQAAYLRRRNLETYLQQRGFYRGPMRPSVRLGELFVLAGMLKQEEVMSALLKGLIDQAPMGQVLLAQDQVTSEQLDTALSLQEMLVNRTLKDSQAAQCLSDIFTQGKSLPEVLSMLDVPQATCKAKVRFHELLRVAGLVQHSDIELSDIDGDGAASTQDARTTAEILLRNGFIDQRMYDGALRCYFLIASGFLSIEQALIALANFSLNRSTFDETLHELNWTIRTRLTLDNDQV